MFTKDKKITMTKIFLGFISLVLFFYLLYI